MKRSSGPRKTANLSDSIHHQLNMYAIAASAAGVSMLALTQPALAKIIYTPSNILIKVHGGIVDLDLNHDGINDFQFYAGGGAGVGRRGPLPPEGTYIANLDVGPAQQSNRVWAVQSHGISCAAAVPKGNKVGPHRRFQLRPYPIGMAIAEYLSLGTTYRYCPWIKGKQAYLGLKFVVKGKVHFGWARVKILTGFTGFPAKITGYAYETVPNKPIITGKMSGPAEDPTNEELSPSASLTTPVPEKPRPGLLGILALGSPGLPLWRRKERIGTTQ
jgi:hypothetical protein